MEEEEFEEFVRISYGTHVSIGMLMKDIKNLKETEIKNVKQINELIDEIEGLEDKLIDLEKELKSTKSENKDFEKELIKLRDLNTSLEKSAKNNKIELENAKQQIATLSREKEDLNDYKTQTILLLQEKDKKIKDLEDSQSKEIPQVRKSDKSFKDKLPYMGIIIVLLVTLLYTIIKNKIKWKAITKKESKN